MKYGFTAIELLITLFLAAAALGTGYQLYSVVINEDGKARREAEVGSYAQSMLKKHITSAQEPCTPSTPVNNTQVTISEGTTGRATVTISCPNINLPNLSKTTVKITYGEPQKTVTRAKYSSPGGS